ncbi:Abi-alpha family protein [Mycobacterium sp. Lab-001]|uniref:Abi-alpha family protein n=1 Tax=Mycobacterium sp. Lab-001 TaxID=3410136 RepID=UPI003D167CB7
MNDSNGQVDRGFEPRRPAEVDALAAVLREAAGVVELTRGLFSQTFRAVTHPRDAVNGITNVVNYLANSANEVRQFAIGEGDSAGATQTHPLSGTTVDPHAGAAQAEVLPPDACGALSGDGTGSASSHSGGDGSLGGMLLGTVSRVAARPVGMFVDTLRQVQQVQYGVAPSQAIDNAVSMFLGTASRDEIASLKMRGEALLRVSCQPEYQFRDVHPSFSNILDELLPDEARILRFLAVAGTQPAIDVRTRKLFGIGSVKLVGGVNMISEMAGCKWPDCAYQYLANLNRLGLIDFSKEPVEDYRRYALLEVQPRATAAMAREPKSISVYRSISLTSFGRQFVSACIDIEGYEGGGWATDGRADKIVGKGAPS